MNKPTRPYMKADKLGTAYDCPRGWYPLVQTFCEKVDSMMKEDNDTLSFSPWNDFEVTRVKQKWFRLRIYASGVPERREDEYHGLLSHLHEMSARTCANCGAENEKPAKANRVCYCSEECHTEELDSRFPRRKSKKI